VVARRPKRHVVDPALVGAVLGLDTDLVLRNGDLLAELAGGRLVAMEVKADAAPSTDSARHLATLRDRFDESFVAGIVFHTGPRAYRLGDRLVVAPISALWG